jgi:NarL family two-component system sensor histidine kinase LiaS
LPSQSRQLALARRLHDGLAQELIALGYELDLVIGEASLAPSIRGELREIRLKLSEISRTFRDEIYLLRTLTRSSLIAEILLLHPNSEKSIDLSYPFQSDEVESALNSALLELARNAAKYATGFEISHRNEKDSLTIEISDQGSGGAITKNGAFGLRGVLEYLELINGQLTSRSDAHGSRYSIHLPVKGEQ